MRIGHYAVHGILLPFRLIERVPPPIVMVEFPWMVMLPWEARERIALIRMLGCARDLWALGERYDDEPYTHTQAALQVGARGLKKVKEEDEPS